jgi:hypothetical protein
VDSGVLQQDPSPALPTPLLHRASDFGHWPPSESISVPPDQGRRGVGSSGSCWTSLSKEEFDIVEFLVAQVASMSSSLAFEASIAESLGPTPGGG